MRQYDFSYLAQNVSLRSDIAFQQSMTFILCVWLLLLIMFKGGMGEKERHTCKLSEKYEKFDKLWNFKKMKNNACNF